jgi:hypothetical protein
VTRFSRTNSLIVIVAASPALGSLEDAEESAAAAVEALGRPLRPQPDRERHLQQGEDGEDACEEEDGVRGREIRSQSELAEKAGGGEEAEAERVDADEPESERDPRLHRRVRTEQDKPDVESRERQPGRSDEQHRPEIALALRRRSLLARGLAGGS